MSGVSALPISLYHPSSLQLSLQYLYHPLVHSFFVYSFRKLNHILFGLVRRHFVPCIFPSDLWAGIDIAIGTASECHHADAVRVHLMSRVLPSPSGVASDAVSPVAVVLVVDVGAIVGVTVGESVGVDDVGGDGDVGDCYCDFGDVVDFGCDPLIFDRCCCCSVHWLDVVHLVMCVDLGTSVSVRVNSPCTLVWFGAASLLDLEDLSLVVDRVRDSASYRGDVLAAGSVDKWSPLSMSVYSDSQYVEYRGELHVLFLLSKHSIKERGYGHSPDHCHHQIVPVLWSEVGINKVEVLSAEQIVDFLVPVRNM